MSFHLWGGGASSSTADLITNLALNSQGVSLFHGTAGYEDYLQLGYSGPNPVVNLQPNATIASPINSLQVASVNGNVLSYLRSDGAFGIATAPATLGGTTTLNNVIIYGVASISTIAGSTGTALANLVVTGAASLNTLLGTGNASFAANVTAQGLGTFAAGLGGPFLIASANVSTNTLVVAGISTLTGHTDSATASLNALFATGTATFAGIINQRAGIIGTAVVSIGTLNATGALNVVGTASLGVMSTPILFSTGQASFNTIMATGATSLASTLAVGGNANLGSGLLVSAGNTSLAGGLMVVSTASAVFAGTLSHLGTQLGFYNNSAIGKQTVTGAKGGNAALTSLMSALSALGLVTDSTS